MAKFKYDVKHEVDAAGFYHVWLEPTDPKNIPPVDKVYEEARKIVPDYDRREFNISQEILRAGAYHLVEKGFRQWAT